jgi:hypothetical protein
MVWSDIESEQLADVLAGVRARCSYPREPTDCSALPGNDRQRLVCLTVECVPAGALFGLQTIEILVREQPAIRALPAPNVNLRKSPSCRSVRPTAA